MRDTELRDTSAGVRRDAAPTEAEVRARAYEIYRARCDAGEGGDEVADWLAAETQLTRAGQGGAQAVRSSAPAEARDASRGRSDRRDVAS